MIRKKKIKRYTDDEALALYIEMVLPDVEIIPWTVGDYSALVALAHHYAERDTQKYEDCMCRMYEVRDLTGRRSA